jgi:hypothetical protein
MFRHTSSAETCRRFILAYECILSNAQVGWCINSTWAFTLFLHPPRKSCDKVLKYPVVRSCVFWVMTQCRLAYRYQSLFVDYSAEGGSKLLQTLVPIYPSVWCHPPKTWTLISTAVRTSNSQSPRLFIALPNGSIIVIIHHRILHDTCSYQKCK